MTKSHREACNDHRRAAREWIKKAHEHYYQWEWHESRTASYIAQSHIALAQLEFESAREKGQLDASDS